MKVSLPYPISANRYWKIARNRIYRSPMAEAFKKMAVVAARYAAMQKLSGPVEVVVALHPRMTKAGLASEVRVDLDNAIKVTLDALNGIAWDDDKQVVRLSANIDDPLPNGGLTVWVLPVAECEL
jgi:crossover junction endodeoxyribonuclease RusA